MFEKKKKNLMSAAELEETMKTWLQAFDDSVNHKVRLGPVILINNLPYFL